MLTFIIFLLILFIPATDLEGHHIFFIILHLRNLRLKRFK